MSEALHLEGPLDVPVALVIFNRADVTRQVFARIREVRPKRLFVIGDGPRFPAEQARCDAARAEIRVDWPCEVGMLYADANLGCKTRPASGIDWVFSQVDEAIVLEDDCLPAVSFFGFCRNLLRRYRDDERVMCIGGTSLYPGEPSREDASYYFARYGATWGWATWKRAWGYYDVNLRDWPSVKKSSGLDDVFATREERWFWTDLFDRQHDGEISGWDYQWLYARLLRSGLTAAPTQNLVTNLGFRPDATHTARVPKVFDPSRSHGELVEIHHPRHVVPSRAVDEYYFHEIFNPHGLRGIAASRARRLVEALASARRSR